jgi:hypothetical protein
VGVRVSCTHDTTFGFKLLTTASELHGLTPPRAHSSTLRSASSFAAMRPAVASGDGQPADDDDDGVGFRLVRPDLLTPLEWATQVHSLMMSLSRAERPSAPTGGPAGARVTAVGRHSSFKQCEQ